MEQNRKNNLLWLGAKALFVLASAVFIYAYGMLLLELVAKELAKNGVTIQELTPQIVLLGLIVVGTMIFLAVSRFLITKHLEITGNLKDKKVILGMYSFLVWLIVFGLIIFTIFKDVGALITSIGLIGFGITFALQQPLLNIVGWLAIVFGKPFTIGDRIEVNNIKGDVISINKIFTAIQATRVDTHEKAERIVNIPNSVILTNPVVNYTRLNDHYVDDVTISITYESNWRKAMRILEFSAEHAMEKYMKKRWPKTKIERKSWDEAVKLLEKASKKLRKGMLRESMEENIGIMKAAETMAEAETPKPKIQMQLANSSINLNVMYYTDIYSVRDTKHAVIKTFMEEIEKHDDIEIAYPHMQIIYKNDNSGKKKNDQTVFDKKK